MKALGYILTFIGIGFLASSGKVWHWGKDGKPIWKHLLLDIIGIAIMLYGLSLIGK